MLAKMLSVGMTGSAVWLSKTRMAISNDLHTNGIRKLDLPTSCVISRGFSIASKNGLDGFKKCSFLSLAPFMKKNPSDLIEIDRKSVV